MQAGSVAIAVPSDLDRAREVIHRGRRIARALGLEWIALRVVSRERTKEKDAGALRELVVAFGGRLLLAEARDIAGTLIELSRREQARVLVLGRSQRPRILRRLRRGTTERVLSARRSFDVVVASGGAGG